MASPLTGRRVWTLQYMGLDLFSSVFLFFQHERTPYLQIISPDLSVTVFVTLHLWALKNNRRNAPRTSVEKHLLGVFTILP